MGNLRMNADQISYKGGNKPMTVEEAIKNAGNTGLVHTADIAPDFSTETAYSAGDFVYYNGALYVFTANHAAGAWSTDDTQVVTVGGEIATLAGDAADLNSNKANQITIAPFFNAEASYDPGDLVYYNGLSFRCVNAHEGAWDFDDFAATTIANELGSLMRGLTSVENTVDKIPTSGDVWYSAVFGTTAYGGKYYAPLNPLPAHTTATLVAVNELGVGDLTLADFTLAAVDEHSQSYIYTTNSANAGKICSVKIALA